MENQAILPETGFLRINQILGDPNSNPPTPAIIPVSRASWWAGVADGRYPPAVKLGPRTTAWRVCDIIELVKKLGGES